jgi:hypothetical protein
LKSVERKRMSAAYIVDREMVSRKVNGWKHLASRLKYVKTDKTSTDYILKRFKKCA